MKTIIAGSRTISDQQIIITAMNRAHFNITEVVSGGASGVDTAGELWATTNKIPIKRFPANWKNFGKIAGPIRNNEMAVYADALIAIWDGKSKGTLSMIFIAQKLGLKVFIHRVT